MLGLALQECQAIRQALADRDDVWESNHEARKAIRRLRSLLAMARPCVDGLDAPERSLQRLGRGLSTLRDAHVAIVTAREVAARDESAAWQPLVDRLVRRRDALLARELARDPGFARRRRAAAQVGRALRALNWEPLDAEHIRAALRHSRKRVAKAKRRANSSPGPENQHRWRRRARRLRMQLESTRALAPELAKAVARPSLHKQLDELNRLGDALGRLQDMRLLLAVLMRTRNVAQRPRLLQQLREAIDKASL